MMVYGRSDCGTTMVTTRRFSGSSENLLCYGKSKDPKILPIKKICDGLEITLIDFFNSPEFESLEPEIQ